jgi:hypothetical protein
MRLIGLDCSTSIIPAGARLVAQRDRSSRISCVLRAQDRLIVITDEQSADTVHVPATARAYMINVASNRNGVGYGKWVHFDGFSEQVLRYIAEYERAYD